MADVILVVHAALVLFNLGALPVIWLGYCRGWLFVRNFYFRMTHLVLIAIVAAESVLGIACPLTVWESALRSGQVHENGFVAHWLQRLLFYDLPGWVFGVAYGAFFLLVLVTFYVVRPEWPHWVARRSR